MWFIRGIVLFYIIEGEWLAVQLLMLLYKTVPQSYLLYHVLEVEGELQGYALQFILASFGTERGVAEHRQYGVGYVRIVGICG